MTPEELAAKHKEVSDKLAALTEQLSKLPAGNPEKEKALESRIAKLEEVIANLEKKEAVSSPEAPAPEPAPKKEKAEPAAKKEEAKGGFGWEW